MLEVNHLLKPQPPQPQQSDQQSKQLLLMPVTVEKIQVAMEPLITKNMFV
jgi:hypothetical protein